LQVRKSVAEQLYVRLLTLDEHPCYKGFDLDTAQEVRYSNGSKTEDSYECAL
jgi:hypothetical protein